MPFTDISFVFALSRGNHASDPSSGEEEYHASVCVRCASPGLVSTAVSGEFVKTSLGVSAPRVIWPAALI